MFCVICDFTERKFDKTTKNDCKKSNYMILLSSVDKRPHGQAVKTSPSHGENRGSIPLGTAKKAVLLENKAAFFFAPQENICFGV